MQYDVIILGAGMVGVSAAIHLVRRGRSVLLVDRGAPGRETSYGNGGIIQAEGVRPHAFPRAPRAFLDAALNRGAASRYDLLSLPSYVRPLALYWWYSAPDRYDRVITSYAPLIRGALDEHRQLIKEAGVEDLMLDRGFLVVCRTQAAFEAEAAKAADSRDRFGVGHELLSGADLAAEEPGLATPVAGALRWTDPWTTISPGDLVAAYARLCEGLGGVLAHGDAASLDREGREWRVRVEGGTARARDVLIALGPWSAPLLRRLGYRLPLFGKRGYHMHYRNPEEAPLRNWMLDVERGYLMSPQRRGIRITSGAEFSALDNPSTPYQIDKAEGFARELIGLGERVDAEPWMGTRLCTPDMMPVFGPAPRHEGLWLNVAHSHHGFTLGPITGRLLAERITGAEPFMDMSAFRAERF